MTKSFVTRFAPSPSGYLHLGHAYSAMLAFRAAEKNQGRFLLRIEDIDKTRCKLEFEEAIYEDLGWLGLDWEHPVRRQSDYFDDYLAAINVLQEKELLYPCFCTRKDIREEIRNSAHAPHGPDGPLYPGTCRDLDTDIQTEKIEKGLPFALRLDVGKALSMIKIPLTFRKNEIEIVADPASLGDIVVARKDVMTSYHLSVVVDDHLQGITHVIRGQDLFHATHIHRLLQELLRIQPPQYHHHGLLVGADGRRFAKRDRSMTIKALREGGKTLSDLFALIKAHGGDLEAELPF